MSGTRTTGRVGDTELENQTALLATTITSHFSCYGLLPLKLMLKFDWQFGEVGTSRVIKIYLRACWLLEGKAIPHVLTAPAISTPLPFSLLPWGETTRGLCWKPALHSYLLSTNAIMGTTPLMTSCNVNFLP